MAQIWNTLPRNRKEMLRAQYERLSDAKCKTCGAAAEWWKTTHGKKLLFEPMSADNSASKLHKCSQPTDAGTRPDHKSMEADVQRLLTMHGARLVVALKDDGTEVARWRTGIPGEDLRHELITVANNVRNAIEGGR